MSKHFYQLQDEMNEFVEGLLEQCKEVRLGNEKWPLDVRALPRTLYLGEDCMIVPKQYVRSLDYYGGFEYVDEEYRQSLGDYVMYSTDDSRVAHVVNAMNGVEEEEEVE